MELTKELLVWKYSFVPRNLKLFYLNANLKIGATESP